MHQQHIAVKPPVRPFVKGYYSDIASIPIIGTAGFALLTVLFNHCVKTNLAWPSQERLSELTGLCRNSIAKHAGTLANEDKIDLGRSRSPRNGLLHNTYTINEPGGYWVPLHTDIISLIPELGHIGFGIYSLIARYADRSSFIAYPSDAKLTAELGICERTLKTHLGRVLDCGIIQRSTTDWRGSETQVYVVTGLAGELEPNAHVAERNEHPSERNEQYSELESPFTRALSKSKSYSESKSVGYNPPTPARETEGTDLDPDQNATMSTAPMAAQTQWTNLEDLETERSATIATSSRAASTQGTDANEYKTRTLTYRDSLPLAAMSATARVLEVAEYDNVDELDFLPAMDPLDGCDDDTSYQSSVVPGTINPAMFAVDVPLDDTATCDQTDSENQEKTVSHERGKDKTQDSLAPDQTMPELEAVWTDLSQEMQNQVRTAIVNMVADRDGERVAAWSTLYSILAEVSYLGWQRVWRMVGAMPADAQPVVASAFADTPMDVRGRVRQIVATRTIADTLYDQRLAASVSRIESVDQGGLDELVSEGVIVEQNVVYHLPNGGTFVVSVDACGYRGAMAMNLDEALALPSLVGVEVEQRHDIARLTGEAAVAYHIKPTIVAEVAAFLDEASTGRKAPYHHINMPGSIRLSDSEELTSQFCESSTPLANPPQEHRMQGKPGL